MEKYEKLIVATIKEFTKEKNEKLLKEYKKIANEEQLKNIRKNEEMKEDKEIDGKEENIFKNDWHKRSTHCFISRMWWK